MHIISPDSLNAGEYFVFYQRNYNTGFTIFGVYEYLEKDLVMQPYDDAHFSIVKTITSVTKGDKDTSIVIDGWGGRLSLRTKAPNVVMMTYRLSPDDINAHIIMENI